MNIPILRYCYFAFKGSDGSKQDLCVSITDSLSLEWKLYINDRLAGTHLDTTTNILIDECINNALFFPNVLSIHNDLFQQLKNTQVNGDK